MKRITFFAISLIALSSILWISCAKEVNTTTESLVNHENISIGEDHNDILTNYFRELNNANIRSDEDLSIEDKIAIIDDYFVENNYGITFTEILDLNPEMYNFLEQMHGEEKVEQDYRDIFQELHNSSISSEKELNHHNALIDIAYNESLEASEKIASYNSYKYQIEESSEFTQNEKNRFVASIELATASTDLWNNLDLDDVDFIETASWAARDVAGAAYAATSGISNTVAALGGGPWGWLAATVGVGVFSSMIPVK